MVVGFLGMKVGSLDDVSCGGDDVYEKFFLTRSRTSFVGSRSGCGERTFQFDGTTLLGLLTKR